jgi:hypothetical protein
MQEKRQVDRSDRGTLELDEWEMNVCGRLTPRCPAAPSDRPARRLPIVFEHPRERRYNLRLG